MAKKVLSIEISYPVTKVAEVDFKSKKSKVYQCFGIKTPEGTIEDGFFINIEEFSKVLKEELNRRNIKTKQAVFTITSSRIATREVTIPAVKIKQIGALVQANASEYFPVDLSGYQIGYKQMDTIEVDGAKQHKLLVVAMPKALVDSYNSLAAAIGLKVVAIDYSGNSIIPIAKAVCGAGVSMLIKVDEHTSQLTVMQDSKSVLQRNVQVGVDYAVETMMDLSAFGRDLTYEEALEMLRGKTCIRKSFDASVLDEEDLNNDDEKYMLARIALTDSLRSLVSSVVRVIDYYNSRNTDNPIERFYLTGFGGDFSGLSKLMSTEIGSKVTVLSKIDGINVTRSADSESASIGEYLSCIGAAISPIDYVIGASDRKKSGALNIDLSKVNFTIVAIVVCVVGIIAAIWMAITANLKFVVAEEENHYLKSRINEIGEIGVVNQRYENATQLYSDIKTMYELTRNQNENLRNFIIELQNKMPSEVAFESFSSNIDSVSITLSVRTEEEVGATIANLRAFETISDVILQGAVNEENDIGEKVWKFSITADYAPLSEYDADEYDEAADYEYEDYSDEEYEDSEEETDEEEAEDDADEAEEDEEDVEEIEDDVEEIEEAE